jgi:hypothetical protein
MFPLLPCVLRAILTAIVLWKCDAVRHSWISASLLVIWAGGLPAARKVSQAYLRRRLIAKGSSEYTVDDALHVNVYNDRVIFRNIVLANLEKAMGLANLCLPFAFQTLHAKSFSVAITWPAASWFPSLEFNVRKSGLCLCCVPVRHCGWLNKFYICIHIYTSLYIYI